MPESLTSRKEQAIATKKRIYKCGVELIKKHGYDNITVKEIAEKANVSIGNYYHYFKSKYDLLVEIFKHGDEFFEAEVPKILEEYKDCKDILVQYFLVYARLSINDGVEMAKNLYIPTNKMFLTHGRSMQNMLIQILKNEQEKGKIPNTLDCEEITEKLFVVARGVIFDWCLKDGKTDLLAEMKEIISRMVESYIKK
ncbi:TetR/AcrR family transcriptional regulator [Thermoanaerobacterium thermosaccharolyticum]|uniref:TetR/AcrR family transcriptional regulator n=1 Tax=Thermoanaerobacterium thermosaccharolyticum TaxID=1517 RepID=UPI003DA965AE